jgi:uncharacterized membrane protein
MLSLPFFLFTIWNLSLAAIPVVAARMMIAAERSPIGGRRTFSLVLIGVVWMAFLPNSCYLMTEWRHFLFHPHFRAVRDATNPNDLSVLRVGKQVAFFLAYSGFGMLCFVLAIRPVNRLVQERGLKPAWLAIPFYLAISLGVYLGLILRLNSWDLLTRPHHVALAAIAATMNQALMAVVVAFAAVLALAFLIGDIWMDGLALRLSRASTLAFKRDSPTSR